MAMVSSCPRMGHESFWKTVNGTAVEEPALNSVDGISHAENRISRGEGRRNSIREGCFRGECRHFMEKMVWCKNF